MPALQLIIGNKNYSSWSIRPWLALKQANADFEERTMDLFVGTGWREQLRSVSPTGRIPILKHDELVVHEALAICEYVAELYPAAQLWPEERAVRAHARAISAEMASGFGEVRSTMPMNVRARTTRFRPNERAAEEIKRVIGIWDDCRVRHEARGPYLFGAFSIADAMYAPIASRFRTYHIALPPRVEGYVTALFDHAHVKEWLRLAAVAPPIPMYDKALP